MATGFYTAASGAMMQQRALNVLGNNVSNLDTPGFKAERLVSNVFRWELLNRIEGGDNLIGKGAPVKIVHDVPTNFDEPSALEQTSRPYDLAINGIGFFNVKVVKENPDENQSGNGQTTGTVSQNARRSGSAGEEESEIYLTRNGNFDIDSEGYLILRGAGRVQGKKGDIKIGGSDFQVQHDGRVFDNKGKEVDTLLITEAKDNSLLTVFRNGMYKADPAPQPTPVSVNGEITYDTGEEAGTQELKKEDIDIRQGWLETSNVDLNREMSMLMEVQRNFDTCRQAMKVVDALDQKTVTICKTNV